MIITEDKNIEAGDMVNDFFKIKAFILNKGKAGEEHIKATAMLGINYKVMKMPGENKNEAKLKDGKKPDLNKLDHSTKTKIGENEMEELRDVKKKKKNRPLLVIINCKVMKMFVSNKNKHEAKLDDINYKVLKTLVFGTDCKVMLAFAFTENKQKAELNNINFFENKVKNVKKQDLKRLDHNAKAEMKLKKKKSLRFGMNKTETKISEFDKKEKMPLKFGEVYEDGRLQLAEQPTVNEMLCQTSI